jgi:hypothetical protein
MSIITEFLHQIISDTSGSPSTKRLIVLLCAILISTGFIANLFWKFTVEEFMFNAIMYIIISGMGITGVEKFAPKTDQSSE